MKQANQKLKLKGIDGFDQYYSSQYQQRWTELKSSLYKENIYVKFSYLENEPYYLDPASVCAATILPSSEKNLDLCAAPGGKSLILSSLMDEKSILYSNERSNERKNRLVKVINTCLPEDISSRVKISCSDGAIWCKKEQEVYDSILLDAPCSSERHVLNDEKYLKEWTPSRIKNISQEQWALLSSAWRLLKTGGYLLYSTCAIANQENDSNIEKLLKKFDNCLVIEKNVQNQIFTERSQKLSAIFNSDDCDLIKKIFTLAESTRYGSIILPDKAFSAGPIYFSLLQKN